MSELRAVAVAPPQQQGLSVQNFDDLQRIADYLAKSGLIPATLQKKPADVAIILWKGHELGLSPMQAIDSIDVIQAKPALKPEAQLALIYSRVPEAEVEIANDHQKVSVTVTMKRPGRAPYTAFWDMERAKKLGLANKPNYLSQPMTMLKWRAVGEAARTVFPDITRGMYNTEEAQDFGNENLPATDKAAELEARLNSAKPIESSVEPAQSAMPANPPVQAQQTPAPAIAPTVEESPVVGTSAGDYKPKVHFYKGVALKEIGFGKAAKYLSQLKAAATEQGKALTGDWLELQTRLEQFLAEELDKEDAANQPAAEPNFDNFQP
jgi:hypothetical protein